MDDDRISSSPDEILSHVLSFLPTIDSVRTSVLSKRWRNLWTRVPSLDFEDSFFRAKHGDSEFTNVVDRVVRFGHVSCLRKFRLSALMRGVPDLAVDYWIGTAMDRKVQDIVVECCSSLRVPTLFTCKTLSSLDLSYTKLEVPASIWIPSLKVLRLYWVTFEPSDAANDLFAGCPVLEELYLKISDENYHVLTFNIAITSLKRLELAYLRNFDVMPYSFLHKSEDYSYSEHTEGYILSIEAPNLKYLHLAGIMAKDFSFADPTSLSKAYIDVGCALPISDIYKSGAHRLLSAMEKVESLALSDCACLLLTDATGHAIPVFHNLTHLELDAAGYSSWKLLTEFMERSPKLELLTINEGCKVIETSDRWVPPAHVPVCLSLHLKEIEIRGSKSKQYKFEAMEYMMRNAKNLNKMKVYLPDMKKNEAITIVQKISESARRAIAYRFSLEIVLNTAQGPVDYVW